ncbi:MAG: hypothetical protein FWF43_06335 [Propionibacteriaceae bacterium]|nr:hypothetical protein [Propionibacteriaceae bacterium]
MTIKKRIAAMAAAFIMGAGAIGVMGTTEAQAIIRVPDAQCNGRTDLFTTYSTTGNTCWDQVGTAAVVLVKVASVTTGVKTGTYTLQGSPATSFTPGHGIGMTNYPTIVNITITKNNL